MKTSTKQLLCCAAALLLSTTSTRAQVTAFPSAEGYGKYTTGGRGGRIMIVTNLNDSGPGSLREAIESSGARTVVFALSGTIELESHLVIKNDNITIAGQTAPGQGICLKDSPLVIDASNVIVRYLRVRLGDKYPKDSDAVGGGRAGQKNVILDHLSVSWSIDECLSIYKTENLTVQWCLVSHSLSKSKHTKGNHGFGGIWGGYKATFHHNMIANHSSRNPRFASVEGTKMVDFRNNSIYNWGFKTAYGGGQHGEINMVANYFKPGPASKNRDRIMDVSADGTGRYFIEGNMMEGSPEVSADNWRGVGGKDPSNARVDRPYTYQAIDEDSPQIAFNKILATAGCSYKRDSYDREVMRQAKRGVALNGKNGIINSPSEVGGWPKLKNSKALKDSDSDGIPDKWERSHGLNPNDPSDSPKYTLDKSYTNIEIYINSLTY